MVNILKRVFTARIAWNVRNYILINKAKALLISKRYNDISRSNDRIVVISFSILFILSFRLFEFICKDIIIILIYRGRALV